MKNFRDDLRSIYNDFYGTGDSDPSISDEQAKGDSSTVSNANSRDTGDAVHDMFSDIGSGAAQADPEAVAQAEAKDEEPKEPEKSGMEELEELIGLASPRILGQPQHGKDDSRQDTCQTL